MYILIILQQLIASTTHIVAKDITGVIEPKLILLIRSSIAALMFILWILFKEGKFFKIEKKDWLQFIILGALNVPVNQLLFFLGIHLTTAPNVALAYALSPAFVALTVFIMTKQNISKLKILGLTTAFLGTLLVLFEKGFSLDSKYFSGNILAILASIAWALYTVMGQKFSIKYGAIYTIGWTMILGFILYLPIFFIFGSLDGISSITSLQMSEIAYLGIFTSGIAYILWYYALKKIDAGKVAVFSNLQPVLTTLMAIFIFGFNITMFFIVGGVLIIFGVILTQKG